MQIMNDNKAKHKHESNSLLYLPVGKGGKGMQELETLYKTTKIKTAHYLTVRADPQVRKFKVEEKICYAVSATSRKKPYHT